MRPDDPDLALLAGDRLYALGLERLAALGDLEAVAELADVIALARRRTPRATPRAPTRSGRRAAAVGDGPGPDHQAAKRGRGAAASARTPSIIFARRVPQARRQQPKSEVHR